MTDVSDAKADSVTAPGAAGDSLLGAAGVLFITSVDGVSKVLLLQRGPQSDHPGQWAFPGGCIEPGETPRQAAAREVAEETGFSTDPDALTEHCRRIAEGVEFTTFLAQLDAPFEPVLCDENSAWVWAPATELPANMHPGAVIALQKLTMDELGIARAIRDGDLASPVRYKNVWLFDLRITGTGMAYRSANPDTGQEEEYAWRPPSFYLNDEFLARSNGLAVIFEHPEKTMLNSAEYKDRAVGAIMLPYIDRAGVRHPADEVWGIAKIYDIDTALLMSPPRVMSTSPGVILRGGSSVRSARTKEGVKILVENEPALLDHLAICEVGVWDKADPPRGVNTTGDQLVTDEEREAKAKADAAEAADKEKADAARKDAEEKEKADQAKVDAAKRDADAGTELDKKIDAKLDAKFDSFMSKIDAKLDSMKADAGKKDGADEDEGKAAQMAADKKDAEDKEKADAAEAARCDAAKKDEEERADMKRRLDAAESALKDRSDSDEKEMTDAQAKADAVMTKFGERAPPFLRGESSTAYRRRLADKYKPYSPDWKDIDLAKVDSTTLAIAEKQIWDSARAEANNPARHTGAGLQMISEASGGHEIHEFRGQPRDWMDGLAGGTRQHVTSILTPNGAG